ncbi:helix-turn-helix transcriptional regulator [Ancylobacter dichloromethanicus]|uniref:HTH cro/C1-type domain-containing protein n=1 Tax=Ancylobacter dichloromethanicus TaxID=518825 RepID=A0A9W6JCV8_9HYPH|nr:helix-turn-helix transcriptional regulator [Ancylobacter dichloromethanicus]MBS7552053.1 helix-turn-helix transcriptional regulator [Ancylobacter dichloromethanicus]GLK74692.1 hypothetical protein GCM10017643_48110 [Ancylobacter dichloromethanicus]
MTDTNRITDFGGRFIEIRKALGISNATAMSKHLGIGVNAWRTYEEGGGTPSWSTLTKLADLGFSLNWILKGAGDMRADSAGRAGIPIDRELMARVTDMIARTYKDMGATISPADLGRLSIENYAEILRVAEAPEDYEAQVALAGNRLRRLLKESPPGSGKRSASAS